MLKLSNKLLYMMCPKNGFLFHSNLYNTHYVCCNKRKDYFYFGFYFYERQGPTLDMSDWIRHDFGIELSNKISQFISRNK